jgi:hypothetical protein
MPQTYTTKRQEALNNINNYASGEQLKIDQYSKELEALNSQLNQLADKTSAIDYKVNETTGYIAILTAIANFLNKSRLYFSNKWSYEELELMFYFLLSLTLEIVICLLYYLKKYNELNGVTEKFNPATEKIQVISKNNKAEIEQPKQLQKSLNLAKNKIPLLHCDANNTIEQPKLKSKFTLIKNVNPIGFKLDKKEPLKLGDLAVYDNQNDDFTDEELKEYLNYIYANKKDDVSPGQAKICENTSLSYKQVKAIRYFLESQHIIKIDARITILLIDELNVVLKMLGLEENK